MRPSRLSVGPRHTGSGGQMDDRTESRDEPARYRSAQPRPRGRGCGRITLSPRTNVSTKVDGLASRRFGEPCELAAFRAAAERVCGAGRFVSEDGGKETSRRMAHDVPHREVFRWPSLREPSLWNVVCLLWGSLSSQIFFPLIFPLRGMRAVGSSHRSSRRPHRRPALGPANAGKAFE